jgi:hypothetical protein
METDHGSIVPAPVPPPRSPGQPVTGVDWFRRAPTGGTVNSEPPATSAPPRDLEAATTEP